jgi:hypothetical protein
MSEENNLSTLCFLERSLKQILSSIVTVVLLVSLAMLGLNCHGPQVIQLPIGLAKLRTGASMEHLHMERDEDQIYFSCPVSEEIANALISERAADLGVESDDPTTLPEYYLGPPAWWKPAGQTVSLRRRDTTDRGIVDTTHYLHECFWVDGESGRLFWWQSSSIDHW